MGNFFNNSLNSLINQLIIFSYGFRNWNAENFVFNKNFIPPSQQEYNRQQEELRQRMLVEEAKNKLLAHFPFYTANLMNEPQPVPPPTDFELHSIPVPPTPVHEKNLDPLEQ